ncbi:MAG: hypothetical protein HOM21_01455, partial [Halobacteriovoraceae bacterium]|nr:hypothetical protein [Halobacteriovoraceae bacterium]
GEALASIASISRLTCVTSPYDNLEMGGVIELHGGQIVKHQLFKGTHSGCSFYIKDLFYNTPARLKFIKSKTAEKNSLKKMIHSFILAQPQITFSVKWDDKEATLYPNCQEDYTKRISSIFFKKNEPFKKLFHLNESYEGYFIEGYISQLSTKGNSGKHQFLFVNGRIIFDKALHQTVLRGMERYWPDREFGHYLISLTIPFDELDVNVHPNKTQIKFFKSGLVYSLIKGAIEASLAKHTKREPIGPPAAKQVEKMGMGNSYQKYENIEGFKELHNSAMTTLMLDNGHQLLFFPSSKKAYLTKPSAAFWAYFKQFCFKEFPVQEVAITPLLISEPFELAPQIAEHIEFLKMLGFEGEKLENGLFVVRTIPDFFNTFSLEALYPLFDCVAHMSLSDSPSKQLGLLLEENLEFPNLTLSSSEWDTLIATLSIDKLVAEGLFAPLNDARIEQIFNS